MLTRDEDYAHQHPSLTRRSSGGSSSPPAHPSTRAAPPGSGPPTTRSAPPNARSPSKPRSPTSGWSKTNKPAARREKWARARHRSAHKLGPRRAKPRGRLKAPDVCASLRQSPAPTNNLRLDKRAGKTGDSAGCPNTGQDAPIDTSPDQTELTGDDLTPRRPPPDPSHPQKIGTQDLTFIGRSTQQPVIVVAECRVHARAGAAHGSRQQPGTRCGYVSARAKPASGRGSGQSSRPRCSSAPSRVCLPVIILAPTGRCIEITQEREQNCWAREARRRGDDAKLGPEISVQRARYWMRGSGVGAQDLRKGPVRRHRQAAS